MKLHEVAQNIKPGENSKIIEWLTAMKIKDYTINDNGIVNVEGNVNMDGYQLKYIPFQFGHVAGYFDCSDNNLTNLKGCPHTVTDNFVCSGNKLTSLEGAPRFVGRDFCCYDNPQLDNWLQFIFNTKFKLVGRFIGTGPSKLDNIINDYLPNKDLLGFIERVCELNNPELFQYVQEFIKK